MQSQGKIARKFDAVVLAAGKGTRMKSDLPKVLHRAGGWTLIRLVAEALRGLGAREVAFVVGHGREAVESEIKSWKLKDFSPAIAIQAEQKGTGDAVRVGHAALAGKTENTPVLILSGDTPLVSPASIAKLFEQHAAAKAALTVGAMRASPPTGYGRLIIDGDTLERIVEEKDASAAERAIDLVSGGVYVADADLLATLLPKLAPRNTAKELYFTDMVQLARDAGKKVAYAELPDTEVQGINDLEQLADVANDLRRIRFRELLKKGVIVHDPRHSYIDMDVEVEAGAVLEANTYLFGKTKIGAGARIEAGARLENAVIHAGARVKAYSCLEDCEIGTGAVVGPMAHLRPGTVVGANSKIGNFVELKKTEIGENSKISHLSYVGDAEVGRDVNIGCGFITCNYDGFQKHQTVIGDRVFIGSDVQAVAPITIGDDAYVASGTTVTKSVPPTGDLVIGRARQENKTGYAKRLVGMKREKLKQDGER